MAHAYTPGLRVTEHATIQKRRILPIPGEVLVHQGDRVDASTVVARTDLPGGVHALNVINLMGIAPEEIRQFMLKKEGDPVARGEPVAQNKPLIKWFMTQVKSPIEGSVESISEVTGQVLLREPPRPLELRAHIDGFVVEVLQGQGVVMETRCALLQGIFGIGGEAVGPLAVPTGGPDDVLTADKLTEDHRGKIVVGGAFAGGAVFGKARQLGVKGIVVGGLDDGDLRDLLGYDLGVAITGTEQVGFTLVVTEGFGRIAMAPGTFELLAARAGRKASINGATQIRAGVVRPEIIFPEPEGSREGWESAGKPGRGALQVGDTVRLIREPHFGRIGRVSSLPSELQEIESGSLVRVLEVSFPDGRNALVPRSNVEIIEE